MELSQNILDKDEIIIYTLRKLYKESGYKKYRMSKFEEYDLYVRNKDFLISDNIITFTDIDGKLMALKPDVTLSIIKNSKDSYDDIQKLYYNENVYRASQDTQSFKEIMQVGVECIGDINSECVCENILLAAKSLSMIKEDYILDISHLGIIEKIIKELGISETSRKAVLKALGEKNLQAADDILKEEKIPEDKGMYIKTLISTYGTPGEIIEKLKNEEFYPLIIDEIKLLEEINLKLKENNLEEKTRIDFSVINDMNYYNGIAFKGFINGVPGGVLSGGQYDKLMVKMDRKSRAIGFAVYLDVLERI